MSIHLTVTAGPHAGCTFHFDRHDTFLIGRADTAHFALPDDPYFSRIHCLIEANPPRCSLTDLTSRNGTFVNGSRATTIPLANGDVIRGGRTAIRVSIDATTQQTIDLPAQADPWATIPPSPDQPPLTLVPGYRQLEQLGVGGMGIVFRAVRDSDQAVVALKLLKPELADGHAGHVARFLREVAILQRLRHPNIVAFLASGEAPGGLLYFAMEYVPGTDAAALVGRDGPLAVPRAVRLLRLALDALAYAHAQGFVHRDVKPANLLIHPTADGEALKVADFGLGRAYQDSPLSGLTLSGRTAGTPRFMPPEQVTDFRGAQPAADQYAAMATLYHLLTGAYTYDAASAADLFRKLMTEEPVPIRDRRPDVPDALARVVHRGLERRPGDRFRDVGELSGALQPFA